MALFFVLLFIPGKVTLTLCIKSNKLIINVGYCDVVLSEDKGVFEIANGSKVELKNILKENLKQEIMAKYKEQLKVKTFTFVLDNGNYVLKNIEG